MKLPMQMKEMEEVGDLRRRMIQVLQAKVEVQ